MELFPYTPQMIDNQYAISDPIQDFISFELLSFGLGEDLGFIFRDKDKPLIDTWQELLIISLLMLKED